MKISAPCSQGEDVISTDYDRSTHLVVDPGPEAAAHIAAAASIPEDQPANLLVHSFDICVCRWLLLIVSVMTLGRALHGTEAR